jgi:hypothetical protein
MSLGDVIVQREVSDGEAKNAIAALFEIGSDAVLIVPDLASLTSDESDRQVLCHKFSLPGGQYRCVLSLHEGRFMNLPRVQTALKLSGILSSDCLISDESVNPYSFTLVGSLRPVMVRAERLGSVGEYEVIASE